MAGFVVVVGSVVMLPWWWFVVLLSWHPGPGIERYQSTTKKMCGVVWCGFSSVWLLSEAVLPVKSFLFCKSLR